MTILQYSLANLRVDVNSILEMIGIEPATAPFKLALDIVFPALLTTPIEPPPERCVHAKGHRSIRTTEGEDARVKKERTNLEATRRASLIDEETYQVMDQELAAGISTSLSASVERSTTDGAMIVVITTESDPTINDDAGSRKPYSPTY